ncbi:hypothetical protein PQX77_017378 [Marasmius sp. AFHP31]|nr:hypothetical protein PQX77_017378 [Marasmius sp. AFHP31]
MGHQESSPGSPFGGVATPPTLLHLTKDRSDDKESSSRSGDKPSRKRKDRFIPKDLEAREAVPPSQSATMLHLPVIKNLADRWHIPMSLAWFEPDFLGLRVTIDLLTKEKCMDNVPDRKISIRVYYTARD